ncbi:MAG TPA: urease accessory UreF family protein [Ktedonobacteraceae bacterium]
MRKNAHAFLQLLQLADSALPIGTAAHSFGLETLVAEQWLEVENLERFLGAYMAEAGMLECIFCLLGQHLGAYLEESTLEAALERWLQLNARLSAFKTARESREASAALGRRLLQLALGLEVHPCLADFVRTAKIAGQATHHSVAFGLLGGLLQIDETEAALAYLQQSLTGLVSACQRLLPLGQSRASQMLWHLHSTVLTTVERSKAAATDDEISCFTALVDLGSMLHPAQATRLFIS